MQICEACNEELVIIKIGTWPAIIDYHNCSKRQAPEFYVHPDGDGEAWAENGNPFYVVAVGEMRIIAMKENGERVTISDTEELLEFGITNDEQLREWVNKGDEVFYYRLNPWFEVHCTKDPYWFSDPFFEFNDAIETAKEYHKHPEDAGIEITEEDN